MNSTNENKPKNSHSINPYLTKGKVAILIDGAFFLRRLKNLPEISDVYNVDTVVQIIKKLCARHAKKLNQEIYRIFFYDSHPFENGIHNPLSGKFIKFKESEVCIFKNDLFNELRKMRKMALRLGQLHLNTEFSWQIKPLVLKKLLARKISIDDLNPDKDISLALRQKQVDMKIGVDITSMALKHQVSTIVLVAGDGDFVPAAKLARTEGVDFILDSMGASINPELNEHIDGLHSVLQNKQIEKANKINKK